MMKPYLHLVILALFLCLSVGASDKPQQGGKTLIEEAEDKANIFALPSFEIKANIRLENIGKMLEGSYSFLWNGPEDWREEINLPGYSEIQVGGKGVVFLKRTTEFLPLRIDQLHSTLGYGTGGSIRSTFVNMEPAPNETVKKVQDRNEKGRKLSCVEMESVVEGLKSPREVCVDASKGTLVRRVQFLDGDPMPVGTKMFPRFLSYVEDGKPLVEVQIIELNTSEPAPLSTFEPPQGATSRSGCMNPIPPYLLRQPQPKYPLQERAARTEGKVSISTLIGSDGMPRQLKIVSGATPGLNSASADGVQQWRYSPATCSGHPEDFETIINIVFKMS
jgi:TonB family protein